ncbi:hypothetical protein TcG_12514 [Trypanosoma cruzi]|nr:hypothetical protein TcG_12514 [Trypanosoma cruzi]
MGLVHPHRMLGHKNPKIHKSHDILYHKSSCLVHLQFPNLFSYYYYYCTLRRASSLTKSPDNIAAMYWRTSSSRTPNLTALVAHIIGIDYITSLPVIHRRAVCLLHINHLPRHVSG